MAFEVLGIAGSLRSGSHNRRLLIDLAATAPAGIEITVFRDLHAVPLFDEDVEEVGIPVGVRLLATAVADADALIISTPEYNQSMPGVLKNALDWLSRPSVGTPLQGKPVAIIGATVGIWGTRLAQSQIRGALLAMGAWILPSPALFAPRAATEAWDDQSLAAFSAAFSKDLTHIGRLR